jgi:hypothetical protein
MVLSAASLSGVSAARSMVVAFKVRIFVQSSLPSPVQLGFGYTPNVYRVAPNSGCNPGGGSYFFSSSEFAPRSTYEYTGAVLIANAVTPRDPEGDPAILANARLQPTINVGVFTGAADQT